MRSQDDLKKQIENLENEYYWSVIEEMEKEAKQILKQQTRQKEKIDRISEKINNFENMYKRHKESLRYFFL